MAQLTDTEQIRIGDLQVIDVEGEDDSKVFAIVLGCRICSRAIYKGRREYYVIATDDRAHGSWVVEQGRCYEIK